MFVIITELERILGVFNHSEMLVDFIYFELKHIISYMRIYFPLNIPRISPKNICKFI